MKDQWEVAYDTWFGVSKAESTRHHLTGATATEVIARGNRLCQVWRNSYSLHGAIAWETLKPITEQEVCDLCNESDNDYCMKCGAPHGDLREMLFSE